MKRTLALLLALTLLLSGCSTGAQTSEATTQATTLPTEEIPITASPSIPEEVTEPTFPEEPTIPEVEEPEPTEPEIPEETEEEPTAQEPNHSEAAPDPTPQEPPKPSTPATSTKPSVSQKPSTPSQPTKPTTSTRPTSSATCRDTGSDEIWQSNVINLQEQQESCIETDPERADYLAYLQESGNPYYYWLVKETMIMYLGKTYGMPLYTSYEYMVESVWTSSDPSVATVNHVGFVTPLKEGEVEISVTHTDPETQETSIRTCSVLVTTEPQYTYAQLEQMAKDEARDIANYLRNNFTFNSDLELIAAAATVIITYVGKGHSTSLVPGYNQPFGTLVTGYSSCAGSTRALGLVLEYLGFEWYHVNENQWDHQWCVVYDVDGQTAFADGSMYGIAGYGERKEDQSNWMQYTYGSLHPFS